MTFLINASNLKQGGGLQVAHSVCSQLGGFKQHRFVVVLSSYIQDFDIPEGENCIVYRYDIKNNAQTLLLGRDKFLDGLVSEHRVEVVLTIFGPSRWRPRCKHLCGFARAQLLLKDPLNSRLSLKERLIYGVWKWGFKKSSNTFYTENSYISNMLPQLLGDVKVYTVTNYYNQVFDQPGNWKVKKLPAFDGITLLTLATAYPHKNLKIAAVAARVLTARYPGFAFRFIFSIDKEEYLEDIHGIEDHFVFLGKVDIAECPSLYKQCDIAFQPTLMECFTATYPEAMRMERPIITTDLEFAHGLCGDAACYYNAVDAEAAAEAIYRVATDKEYAASLVAVGKKQLGTYDNYEQRAEKLVRILERMI